MESLCNQESLGTWPSCSPRAVLRPGTRAVEPLMCPWVPADPALGGQGGPSSWHPSDCQARGEMRPVGLSYPFTLATKGDVEQSCLLAARRPVSAGGDGLGCK